MDSVGALKNIFEAQYPARLYPCLRFAVGLTTNSAKLGARMDRLLLSRETLSFSTSCRFNPAHVAVGMAVAPTPRADPCVRSLAHTALTLDVSGVKANLRVGMKDALHREPPLGESPKA